MRTEPVLIVTAIMSVLVVLVEFGLPVDGAQQTAIEAALIAVGAIWARSKVSPVDPK